MNDIEMTARIVLDEYYSQLSKNFRHLQRKTLGSGDTKLDTAIFEVARCCVANKIDPRHYVAVVIDMLREPLPGEGKPYRLIKPDDLVTADMLGKYRKRCVAVNGGDPEFRWECQVDQLKRILLLNPQYTTDTDALIMFSFPFESWFRVLYTRPMHDRIFKIYGAIAWDDLREDRLLREYIRGIVPDNMQELERRIAKFIESV